MNARTAPVCAPAIRPVTTLPGLSVPPVITRMESDAARIHSLRSTTRAGGTGASLPSPVTSRTGASEASAAAARSSMACRRVYSLAGGAARTNCVPTVPANFQSTVRPTVSCEGSLTRRETRRTGSRAAAGEARRTGSRAAAAGAQGRGERVDGGPTLVSGVVGDEGECQRPATGVRHDAGQRIGLGQ